MFWAGGADLAIDLGSAWTRLVVRGKGVVLEEPTRVARHASSDTMRVGAEAEVTSASLAQGMQVLQPVWGGHLVHPRAGAHLLHALVDRAGARGWWKPRVLLSIAGHDGPDVPEDLLGAARAAGLGKVTLVPSTLAAALGADLPIQEAVGSLVADLGAGHSAFALISLGGVVAAASTPAGCDSMDETLIAWLRRNDGLLISPAAARAVRHELGCAVQEPPLHARVRGRDLGQGQLRETELDTDTMSEVLATTVEAIRATLDEVLAAATPELAGDIAERGLVLCGGGAPQVGLDRVLGEDTGLPTIRAEHPDRSVSRGLKLLLEDPALLRNLTGEA